MNIKSGRFSRVSGTLVSPRCSLLSISQPGASMFIFERPIAAPLVALATVAMLLILDSFFDLSALL
jgi:hypothetical protein